jgi:hypothetical protein
LKTHRSFQLQILIFTQKFIKFEIKMPVGIILII